MKRLLSFLSVFALTGALLAQDPLPSLKITGPNVRSVVVSDTLPVTIEVPDDGGALYQWQLPDRVAGVSRGRFFDVTSAPAGQVAIGVRYVISNVDIDWEKKTAKITHVEKVNVATFVLGKPTPDPKPDPTPDPKPDPSPVKVDGPSVLILYDKAAESSYTAGQLDLIYSPKFREALDGFCMKGPDGVKAYRIWPVTVDAKNSASWAKDAFARGKAAGPPWIGVYDKGRWVESRLPDHLEDGLALLAKVRGQ